MCSPHFSGPMIGLTRKSTGKFRKTYYLQPKQFAMWQTLIAMQAQISARACFSATKVGKHVAIPPFHILLVFCQLRFFFARLEAPIRHPNIATCCFHDQLSSHVFAFECCSTSEK